MEMEYKEGELPEAEGDAILSVPKVPGRSTLF